MKISIFLLAALACVFIIWGMSSKPATDPETAKPEQNVSRALSPDTKTPITGCYPDAAKNAPCSTILPIKFGFKIDPHSSSSWLRDLKDRIVEHFTFAFSICLPTERNASILPDVAGFVITDETVVIRENCEPKVTGHCVVIRLMLEMFGLTEMAGQRGGTLIAVFVFDEAMKEEGFFFLEHWARITRRFESNESVGGNGNDLIDSQAGSDRHTTPFDQNLGR